MKKYYLLIVIQVLFFSAWAQQGPTCDQIQAFCIGTQGVMFPNTNQYNSNEVNAEIGPEYGCVGIQPYPTWLLIQIDTPGDLEFDLSQNSEMDGSGDDLDADFVIWGPFDQGTDVCDYNASLNGDNIEDCDFTPADIPINIDNAEVGKLYVLMVTNYSGEIGFINIQQNTAAAPNPGTTECTLEQPDLGPDQEICNNEVITLDAMTTDADNYFWEVDNGNGFTVINGENNPTITVTETGIYRVTAVGPNGEQLEDEVEIIYSRAAEISDPYFEAADNFFCVDSSGQAISTVTIGEDLGAAYIYDWTPDNDVDGDGIEEPLYEVTQAGTYELVVTPTNSTCSSEYVANFIASGPPALVTVEVEGESFSDNSMYSARVNAEGGFGEFDYEYSLDDPDGPFQSSNVFNNLTPGSHQIFVRDINECGITASEIFNILDYPKYFTPNGDGIHETWNISALDTSLNADAQIYIFDRYGKLLKQLSPRGQGWNGFFNGRPMPSDTYWFKVEYKEPADESLQEYKSYFLLKR